ncbi:stage II sporulation protein M [Alloiococcus sp. CFN-8]|uniref:stage II sporulation protein M n=1 Tax=Alloiococcus sp. CFN-8 TaxID=3416081 RepID=UPI003CE6EA68
MDSKRLKDFIIKEIENNFWILLVIMLFLTIGIILGNYMVKYMGNDNLKALNDYLSVFLQGLKDETFSGKNLFIEAVRNNVIIIIIIWSCGFTILGTPIVLLINLVKGFTFGFSLAVILAAGGENSLILSILSLIPQNIIYIIGMVIISIYSVKTSLEKLKQKVFKVKSSEGGVPLANYLYCLLFVLLFMTIGFIVEAYITPPAIKYVSGI